MRKIVRPERRQLERRPTRLSVLGDVIREGAWSDRRIQCWNLEAACDEERRRRCAAYFIQRNCWDLWAAEYFPPGRKPCCHPNDDCGECSITAAKFAEDISIYVETPVRAAAPEQAFCSQLYNAKNGQQIGKLEPEGRTADFRCRHRPGIMLHATYVTEVCSCLEHRGCVFYNDE